MEEQKKPYESPKVTYVPLKVEERLMACGKAGPAVLGGCATGARDTMGAQS